MSNYEVAETLRKVKETLKRRGRTRGKLLDEETGRVCLYGAIYDVTVGEPSPGPIDDIDTKMVNSVDKALKAVLPPHAQGRRWDDLTCFNDDRNTTDDDVYDVLDKAIAQQAQR